MKHNLFLIGIIILSAVSCQKEPENTGTGGSATGDMVAATLTLTDNKLWTEDAAVGVFTDMDMNAKFSIEEGVGTVRGKFKGNITNGATLLAAYIPYSEDAGDDMTGVRLDIPAGVQQGDDLKLSRFMAGVLSGGGNLSFSEKLTTLKVSLQNVAGTVYEGKSISSIKVQSSRKITGVFKANLTDAMSSLAETSQSSSSVELSFPENTTLEDGLVGYASVASYIKGGDKLKVTLVVEGESLMADITVAESSSEGQEFNLAVDAGLFEPSLELLWAYGGMGVLNQFSATYPAVDNDGNVYITNNSSNQITKISKDGTLAWAKEIGYTTGSQDASPAVEPDGSVVYVGGGKRESGISDACLSAFDADGNLKWRFTDWWNLGNTPAVDLNQVTPVIGTNNVYIGNGGAAGTVIAINKASGERVSFVSNAAVDGVPSGGVNSGLGLSKNGYLTWHCTYGTFGADVTSLDAPVINDTYGGYALWDHMYGNSWEWNRANAGVACLSVDGVDHVASCGIERTRSGIYKMHVVCAPLSGAEEGKECPSYQTTWTSKHTVEIKCQDQGGIIVGPQNDVIVSLKAGKNTGSGDDKTKTYEGGLYAVNPADGTLSWKFPTAYDVCGAAAVDDKGHVHFVSDDGNYWILRPDYANKSATVLLEENLFTVVKNSRKCDLGTANMARAWTSVIIGNDGKIYIAATFHKDWNDRYGLVLCLQYPLCEGPGKTSWPMKGADAHHSGNQK